LARNNTLSASFSQASGDGATGFSESSGSVNFTSGDAFKIEGNVLHTGATQYVMADFGVAQADGIYFENRDSTNFITLTLQEAVSGSDLCALKIAPSGVFCIRFDAGQNAISHITIQADTAACDFVLCVAE
jgi:hypothetical protein